jgi:hypothetical protein
LNKLSRIGKYIGTGSRLVVASGRERGGWGQLLIDNGVFLWDDENVSNLDSF